MAYVLRFLLFSIAVFASGAALAQDTLEDDRIAAFARASSLEVVLEDQVVDACWQSPNGAKAAVEKALLQSDIPEQGENKLSVVIEGVGGGVKNNAGRQACAGVLSVSVVYFTAVLAPDRKPFDELVVLPVEVFTRRAVFTGPRALDRQFREAAIEWADEISVLWLKSRSRNR